MSISGTDLWQAASFFGIGLAILALLVGGSLWYWKRRGQTWGESLLAVTNTVATVTIFVLLVGIIGFIFQTLTAAELWIDRVPVTPGRASTVSDESSAYVNPSTASVNAVGLAVGTRWTLALADVLQFVILLVPAWLAYVLSRDALRGRPFAPSASRWFFVSAAVILIAGILGDIIDQVGLTLVSQAVLPMGDIDSPLAATQTFSLTLPLWPIGAALFLVTFALILRHGTSLQRDTEGLV